MSSTKEGCKGYLGLKKQERKTEFLGEICWKFIEGSSTRVEERHKIGAVLIQWIQLNVS
jgi:hypothetical protein